VRLCADDMIRRGSFHFLFVFFVLFVCLFVCSFVLFICFLSLPGLVLEGLFRVPGQHNIINSICDAARYGTTMGMTAE
jgi:hypothetical protein